VPGTYTFKIQDSFGDGFLSTDAGYTLLIDDVVKESGGGSFSSKEFEFEIIGDVTTTSLSPSSFPSNLPSSSPTAVPEPTTAPTREITTELICLKSKYKYSFSISDSFGDGMCCIEVNNQ